MRTMLFSLIVLFGFVSPAWTDMDKEALEAKVDSRVELMSLIFRLSGADEYCQPAAESHYSKEADAHFKAFKKHPVVLAAREVRGKSGVGYDAVMSMAVNITDTLTLKERVPFDHEKSPLERRWSTPAARDFIAKARDFVEQSGFNAFFEAHGPLYATAAERMTALLSERDYIQWFDDYFGARPGTEFRVIVGMLNGPANYGISIRLLDGAEEITPVIGAAHFDEEGFPVFSDGIIPTIVHEFCHTYTNAMVNQFAGELEAAGTRIFAPCRQVMSSMAYGNWRTMLYESLVRVCVVRHIRAVDGAKAALKEINHQHQRGFKWIGALSRVLVDYETDRERYPDFVAFMPEIVTFFNGYSEQYEEITGEAPKVVSMIPANGAEDVDPNLSEIRVTFDRPMKDGSWAVVGGGPNYPETTGDCSYDDDCLVFTLPVALKPDWTYRFWLNHSNYLSFTSREGVPLESVAVTFKTGKK